MSASPAYAVARGMIGESGSRYRIPTPALIVDEGLLDANIAAMAQRVRNKAALRPHAKIHKCAWIAHKQIAEGAVGICCAKLGEVEALSRAGLRGILLTSPVVDATALRRLCDVEASDPQFKRVVTESPGLRFVVADAPGLDRLAGRSACHRM
jgi:D-serine deaminase-like pyridoxal phosphate-dependent protein